MARGEEEAQDRTWREEQKRLKTEILEEVRACRKEKEAKKRVAEADESEKVVEVNEALQKELLLQHQLLL